MSQQQWGHGKRFGLLVTVKRVGLTQQQKSLWECLCDCGNTTIVRVDHLNSGHTRSCGKEARHLEAVSA